MITFSGGQKLYHIWHSHKQDHVTVASKSFTEQIILAEIIAQTIENNTHVKVERKFNLGTAAIVHQAMLSGEVDIYPEYTGTGSILILKNQPKRISAEKLYRQVDKAYRHQFQIAWLSPFGFNNEVVVAVHAEDAKKYRLKSLSDLSKVAGNFIIAGAHESVVRADGLPYLRKYYHLHFANIKSLQHSLLYDAIQKKSVNAILTYSTDSRLSTYHLQILQDDKHALPPYYAAPVVRLATLKAHPEIKAILQRLAGKINNKTIRRLNNEVDIQHRTPKEVAQRFLQGIA